MANDALMRMCEMVEQIFREARQMTEAQLMRFPLWFEVLMALLLLTAFAAASVVFCVSMAHKDFATAAQGMLAAVAVVVLLLRS